MEFCFIKGHASDQSASGKNSSLSKLFQNASFCLRRREHSSGPFLLLLVMLSLGSCPPP